MKTKKISAIILTFILCFGVLTIAFADETAEVPEGYTPIYTAEDLYNIRNDLAGKYILMNDIDLSVYENWEPIGTSEAPFTGELDGNGNSILKLKINATCNSDDIVYFGLFGCIDHSTIQNIAIEEVDIRVSYSGTYDTNCRIGAIAGYGYFATLTNCVTSGKINIESFAVSEVGGLVGRCTWNGPANCANYVNINITIGSNATDVAVGGIIGISRYLAEKECANFGNISVEGTDVGLYSYVEIGGIDGNSTDNSTITDSYNRGNISVDFSNLRTYIGGLSGQSNITHNSYSIGKVSHPEEFNGYAGAISGNFFSAAFTVGTDSSMKNIYYIDKEMIPAYYEEYNIEDFTKTPFNNVKLLSEEEFRKQESFVGFDFDTVWAMEENGYPVLQNQPVLPEHIPESSTTESATETTTEPSTESTTEPSVENTTTESSTELSSDECPLANLWIVRAVKWLWDFLKRNIVYAINIIVQ